MFAANDYFDQELQNMIEFSDDLETYDHLIIEIDTILDKYIQKIEETENLPFNNLQIWKYYDEEQQDSMHQFLSNNFIMILLNWFQGK